MAYVEEHGGSHPSISFLEGAHFLFYFRRLIMEQSRLNSLNIGITKLQNSGALPGSTLFLAICHFRRPMCMVFMTSPVNFSVIGGEGHLSP